MAVGSGGGTWKAGAVRKSDVLVMCCAVLCCKSLLDRVDLSGETRLAVRHCRFRIHFGSVTGRYWRAAPLTKHDTTFLSRHCHLNPGALRDQSPHGT